VIVFIFATLILSMLSHFRGQDVTSRFIGIDGRGMFLIQVTIPAQQVEQAASL
jgi:hypothetical protein